MHLIDFSKTLLRWNMHHNEREMPWKNEKDAYKIWISEIILQQTRVEQGWHYYLRFISAFPTIESLANASDEKVFKLWEGLGYYSRCRNLIYSAKYIMKNFEGEFPSNYEDILKLKGIGPYTAAAISSFAYNLPYPVVDGNVLRVLARVFGIYEPVDTDKGKKVINNLATQLILNTDPASFNQAIMDFGATICKPVKPLCNLCPFKKYCIAFIKNSIEQLPVKLTKTVKKDRWIHYFIFKHNQNVLVRKRLAKDIWQNLFEFYPIETPLDKQWNEKEILNVFKLLKIVPAGYSVHTGIPQHLTHRTIRGSIIMVEIKTLKNICFPNDFFWQPQANLHELSFPKYIHQNYFSRVN